MTKQLFNVAKEGFLGADIDLMADTIKIALIDTALYAFNAADTTMADSADAVVGTPVTLAGKSITAGVFDATDPVWAAVPGDGSVSIEGVLIYKDLGGAMTANIPIFFADEGTGLPVVPNGGNINGTFDNGANKIFRI